MFNLVNIFDSFLPQLLAYPNPADPLNGEAASLLLRDPPAYAQRIKGAEGGGVDIHCIQINIYVTSYPTFIPPTTNDLRPLF